MWKWKRDKWLWTYSLHCYDCCSLENEFQITKNIYLLSGLQEKETTENFIILHFENFLLYKAYHQNLTRKEGFNRLVIMELFHD